MNELFLRNQLCIPVKGYNRAIVYDILRKDYFFIPKAHYTILNTNDFIKFNKIKEDREREELIDFLIEEEIIFELSDSDQKKRFGTLNRDLEVANQLTNVIVHSNIDLIFFDFIKDEYILNLSIIAPHIDHDLIRILEKIGALEVDSVYLYIENFDHKSFEEERELISNHNLIFSVNFFGAKNIARKTELYNNIYFNFFEEEFSEYKCKLTLDKLNINTEHFLEAYNFHSYYFGKVYVDCEYNIKNGLNNSESFGNIKSSTKELFLSTISSDSFRELGNITKSNTLVCCDCEFRYMCVDSRVPVKGDENWYHEVECSYNPYLSKWNDEADYLNLIDSGVTVSASGCSIDKKKLSQKFKSIWSA